MKRILFAILTLFMFSLEAYPQALTPCTAPVDFCESAWSVSVNGNYSTFSNATTNNGLEGATAIRLSTHFSGAVRYYQTASPSGKIIIAGPQVDYGLAHILKPTPQFDTTNVDLFAHVSAGAGWSTGTDASGNVITGVKKFAFGIGGGVDYNPTATPNVQLRLLEVSYIRAGILPNGGQFLGNHVQVGMGIQLVFGGQSTPSAAARRTAARLRKQQAQKFESPT